MKTILDPCCGSRMMWLNPSDSRAIFGDRRAETITVTDRSHGREDGTRTLRIEPDAVMDFRALPFPDERFHLVAFDPPQPDACPRCGARVFDPFGRRVVIHDVERCKSFSA